MFGTKTSRNGETDGDDDPGDSQFNPRIHHSTPKNPLHFLRLYFNFGYFTFLHPFRIVQNSNTREYELRTHPMQQITCGIVQSLTLFRMFSSIRKIPLHNIKNNSSIYFKLAQAVESFIYHATVFTILWTKQSYFLNFIQKLQATSFESVGARDRIYQIVQESKKEFGFKIKLSKMLEQIKEPRTLGMILCTFYLLKASLDPIVGYKYFPVSSWSFENLFNTFRIEGEYTLFLRNASWKNKKLPAEVLQNSCSVDSNQSFANSMIFILMWIMQFYRELEAHFADLGLLLSGLTLLTIVQKLSNDLLRNQETDVHKSLKAYNNAKDLSNTLNKAIGPAVLIFVLEAIPYYSSHIGDFMVITDWYHRIRFTFFCGQFFIILIISAQVAHKVQLIMETWLQRDENYMLIPRSKLTYLLYELNKHPIGLRLNGISTITYHFLTTMISLVITYFIIMLQFNAGSCTCSDDNGSILSGKGNDTPLQGKIGMVMPFLV